MVPDGCLVLPGEPLIYSVKEFGARLTSAQTLQNESRRHLLKSYFRSFYKRDEAMVLFVRFFVSPLECFDVKQLDIAKERPAALSFEVVDYLLAFIEMLRLSLVPCYRQYCKIDCEKYYSEDPRTEFKLMSWSDYVKLYKANDTLHATCEKYDKKGQVQFLQPKRKGDAANKALSRKMDAKKSAKYSDRALASDSPLSATLREECQE